MVIRNMTEELGAGTNGAAVRTVSAPPTASFVLSLIAGLIIIAGAGMMALSYGGVYYGMTGGYYGASGGYYDMMQGFGYGGWFYGLAALSVVSGIAVLAGAVMIYTRPSRVSTWGLLVLVFSMLAFFGTGMAFFGAILGVIGGILAMVWKPEVAPK